MRFTIVMMLLFFSLDWSKTCKAVTYEYKQFGVKYYGYGAKKGCATPTYSPKDSEPGKDIKLAECSVIKKDANLTKFGGGLLTDWDEEELEQLCNGWDGLLTETCVWKGGRCRAASCPTIASRNKCGGRFKNGKCEKLTGDDCTGGNSGYMNTPENADCNGGTYTCPYDGNCNSYYDGATTTYYCRIDNPPCSKLTDFYTDYDFNEKYTSDDKKVCEYRCAHPEYSYGTRGPYQYTIPYRKYCHRQLGCLYALNGGESVCSVWSIWAFILVLVLCIVVAVGAVAAVVFLLLRFVFKVL